LLYPPVARRRNQLVWVRQSAKPHRTPFTMGRLNF
jgi:hypothetical protein